jgi:heterotetrameric sarcosine oxidase gamma subunit
MKQYEASIESIAMGVVAVEASVAGLARACALLGAHLPEGARSVATARGLVHRSGPESLLVLADPSDAALLAMRLDDGLDEPCAIVADVGDGHAWMRIAGPGALPVLAHGVAIDLRETGLAPGQATRTLCFGVEAILYRDGPEAVRVGCRASHGAFLMARLRLACNPLQDAG